MDYRQTLQPATVLDGKYRIERVLGSGGFGITYEAYDLGLAAAVAVKEYFPSQFGLRDATFSVRPRSEGDREMFERLRASFLREARTLNQFDHPAIVRVLNVFESHGTAYMVMKYETGPNLKAWLADLQRLPTQSELDRLTVPLLDALETMHGAAFLHRDIAPDNIIVRADGTPVLLDFGASRRVMGEMTGTLTGVVKKGYSPQEQYATDGRAQGPWTDIYALGATLYRCISDETPDEATNRMLDDQLQPAVEVGAGRYRPAFLAAIDAAMHLRPSDRPPSIAVWRGMLFDGLVVQSGHPQSWPATAAIRPANDSLAPVRQSAAVAASTVGRPSGSGRRKAAFASALVALIGGGALFAGWDPVGPGETPTPRASQDVPNVAKTDENWRREAEEAQQRQEREIARLIREAELRAAEEARQRKLADEAEASRNAEEARERAAEEARRVTEEARRAAEEEAHKRQLAKETEARRKAEEAHNRAIEEARQRAAEAARQRKLAEDAEARRLAAEQARLRQEEEIKRLTREAAERASEETRRKIEEEVRQRRLAEEEELQRARDEARAAEEVAEAAEKQRLAAKKAAEDAALAAKAAIAAKRKGKKPTGSSELSALPKVNKKQNRPDALSYSRRYWSSRSVRDGQTVSAATPHGTLTCVGGSKKHARRRTCRWN